MTRHCARPSPAAMPGTSAAREVRCGRKGESPRQPRRVIEMRLDCDQDAVWIKVEQVGAACHTGRRSCFYRKVEGSAGGAQLTFVDADRLFDPDTVYKK